MKNDFHSSLKLQKIKSTNFNNTHNILLFIPDIKNRAYFDLNDISLICRPLSKFFSQGA